ncbi:MAG: arginine deiminase [Defluviitaleaceae bacterium]|nr:arginine deiminase [Defluviitaleaceae bacterium]
MDSAINVKNEIGKLRRVLLHRPGLELEQLSPSSLSDLLFDDIPFLDVAQKEHDEFADVLRKNDIEVLYLADLAAQALATDESIKTRFVEELITQSGGMAQHYQNELMEFFNDKDEAAIISQAMIGVKASSIESHASGPLCSILAADSDFLMNPMPNLYFTRDPFSSVGNRVVHSHMRYAARHRETIFSKYIFNYHPDFKNRVKFYYKNHWPFYIEGGDILNLSEKVVAIGLSQRTYPQAIEIFAKNLFRDEDSTVETMLVFDIPNVRAYMHLDTVFTQVSPNKFTIYAGIQKDITVYVLRKTSMNGDYSAESYTMPLDKILAKYLEQPEVLLIPCGDNDTVASAREQWNDAANTLAIAPGVVVCYNRNTITNRRLRSEGIEVLEIASSELSRGRGGPRCMSMPLLRDDL